MHVEHEGPSDAPDVVLLHGGIGTGRYHWSKQVKALAADFRLHLVDLPGHGSTPLPEDRPYDRALLVDAVRGHLEDLGRPAILVGFSMGGFTALGLAQEHPELLAGLVVIGISIREHEGLHAWRQLFDPDVLEATYPLWARQLAKIHAPLGPDAWRDVCRRDSAGMAIDVDLDRLAGLEVPTMLVRGDRDTTVRADHYAALRETWPHADEFVVPAGGHDVQLTRADLVRPALLDFLRRATAER